VFLFSKNNKTKINQIQKERENQTQKEKKRSKKTPSTLLETEIAETSPFCLASFFDRFATSLHFGFFICALCVHFLFCCSTSSSPQSIKKERDENDAQLAQLAQTQPPFFEKGILFSMHRSARKKEKKKSLLLLLALFFCFALFPVFCFSSFLCLFVCVCLTISKPKHQNAKPRFFLFCLFGVFVWFLLQNQKKNKTQKNIS
jgi:Ca2+/Na+ antiporter